MLVCSARAAELEREFPFGVVRQLAASSYADTTREQRDSWFAGVARMAAPLFREEAIAGEVADASYPRLHALYWLCANAARRRPLVLVVDDAHWADDASLAFAGFLARRVGELPLALVLGTRPPDPDAVPELARVLADPETVTLAPDPLSPAGVTALLRGMLGRDPDPAFADACRAATDGNPFLLGELAREVHAHGIEPSAPEAARVASLRPAGVRTIALVRLARLDVPARRLARTLALLGDHTALPVAAELAGLDESAALAAALALEDAGLVARDGGLGFVHPLLRAAVTDEIPSVEREGGHATAARVLARRGAKPDAVAVHLLRAEPAGDPWVVETLRAGARRALELGDPLAAAAYLRRAIEEPAVAAERPRLLFELGLAEARSDPSAAIASLEQAVAAAGDTELRAEAALQLAQRLNLRGRAGDAIAVLEAGIAAAGRPELTEPLRAELIATAYVRRCARRRLAPLIDSLIEPTDPPRTQLELASAAALAVEHAVSRGDPARGAELARQVLAVPIPGRLHVPVALALIAAERFADAAAVVAVAVDAGPESVAEASGARAAVRLRRDDLLGAEADALACLELLAGAPASEATAMGAAATAVRAGIELGRAPADLGALVTEHSGDPDYPSHASLVLAEGELHALAGDHERALERFERCGEDEWGRDCPALYPWRSAAALALARLGRDKEARALAAEEVALARTPRARGVALHAAAAAASDEALLELAIGELEGGEAPLELARALLARGALRRREGRRTLARADLQRAHELAASRGAVRVADAAADELRASGVRLRRTAARGADALTPSERRVAELAVRGLSNRDIAQSLFLSEKTVEAHLGRAYRKLGIRSRTRLAAALGGDAAIVGSPTDHGAAPY